MAKNTKKRGRKTKPEPRPSYKPVQKALGTLMNSIATILEAGKDAEGELNDVQLAQAESALKLLNGTTALLECPQLFGPYGPHQKRRSKS